jgi:hypothetical protein
MIGVTIGIGGLWPEIAARAARRMEKMSSIRCVVLDEKKAAEAWLSEYAHPSWLKCHLDKIFPQHKSFMIFDADIFCLNNWNPFELSWQVKQAFCAVPDRNLRMVFDECTAHQLPFPDWYVNGGLVIFGREHQKVWDKVWEKHPRYGRWLEQTALNKAIQETGVDVCRLPRKFNLLPSPVGAEMTAAKLREMAAAGVVNFHYADCGGDGAKILALQKELGYE